MSRVLKLAVAGLSGRMGQEVQRVAKQHACVVVGGLSRTQSSLAAMSERPDVVIDFSLPEFTAQVVRECLTHKTPLVSGVTGYAATELQALQDAGKQIPVVWSANMSVGVQILLRALESLRGAEGFDLVMEEIHHAQKRDAPSGTAKLIRDETEKRSGRRIEQIHSLRGGGVVGVHRVLALGPNESLSFEHAAQDRGVFASGACRAAQWLVKQGPGFYSLGDVLNG
ncbi:MAG TPA: 4-hydroxy-tetrahydrodipicolinate reductase [Pseudobdellovibrionaceae bacterium]|nr:4-hydroxy-tetrahydrodipicolinate reductase [Pseudobdellovibrionaceae bacterium]